MLGYLPDQDAPLLEAGLTSMMAVEFRDRIQKLLENEELGTEMLDVTIFFQVSCIRALPAAVKCAASVEDELPEVQIQFTGEPLPRWLFWVLQTMGVWQGNTSSRTILVHGDDNFRVICSKSASAQQCFIWNVALPPGVQSSLASVALPAVVCAWFFDLLYETWGLWSHVVLLPAVPCYLMLFSALVLAQKWIIVYRYRSCALQRWSLAFLRWW